MLPLDNSSRFRCLHNTVRIAVITYLRSPFITHLFANRAYTHARSVALCCVQDQNLKGTSIMNAPCVSCNADTRGVSKEYPSKNVINGRLESLIYLSIFVHLGTAA